MAVFDESKHPRGKGAQGGQFVSKNAAGETVKTSSIGYDGRGRGTGYGSKAGDPNVKALQRELNRLGIFDGQGNQLVVDGKFGPRTTAAVRRLQHRLGLAVDGKVTPVLLRKLRTLKPSSGDLHAMHVRHVNAERQRRAHAHRATASPARPRKTAPAKKGR